MKLVNTISCLCPNLLLPLLLRGDFGAKRYKLNNYKTKIWNKKHMLVRVSNYLLLPNQPNHFIFLVDNYRDYEIWASMSIKPCKCWILGYTKVLSDRVSNCWPFPHSVCLTCRFWYSLSFYRNYREGALRMDPVLPQQRDQLLQNIWIPSDSPIFNFCRPSEAILILLSFNFSRSSRYFDTSLQIW